MELEQLKQVLFATDPATVLVTPRVLRRLLQAEFKVPYLLIQAPHERCYFFDRDVLFRHVDQDELDVEPDRLLPNSVILLVRPSAEQLESTDNAAILLRYWRLLFHVNVHVALHKRLRDGLLTPAIVRSRIDQIGQAEFEEIRTVLQQERDLLPPADDVNTYIEFAAVYLELCYFRSNLRSTYFPAIGDLQAVDKLLSQDVDASLLFARTRLEGAPDPVIRTDTSSDESHDYYYKLLRHAERARAEGDNVRAGILHTRAARVAPVSLMEPTRGDALKDMEALTDNMNEALKFNPDEIQEWLRVLPALLDKSDQGNWPVEAKLLFDLQEVCMEHQRQTFALDLVEWVLSGGKRQIKRPLTSLQLVRTTKHLRSAAKRLTLARVSDEDRQRLARLLQSAEHLAEGRVRERFRPILLGALEDVGLVATNPPEVVAQHCIIEELLDHILERGYFSFSDLRDTISRSQLKLPDLTDPYSYWRGDPVRQLDRRLATLMEGVYRRGEFYLRWMESCSSLFFATQIGRFLTRNLVVPFGGAFLLLKTVEICIEHYTRTEPNPAMETANVVTHALQPENWTFVPAVAQLTTSLPPIVPWYAYGLLGFCLLIWMRAQTVRELVATVGRQVYRVVRWTFYDAPLWLWQRPELQAALTSWPFLLLYWYVLKPLIVCAAIWLYWPQSFFSLPIAAVEVLLMSRLLNSGFGQALSEAAMETFLLVYGWLRFDVFQGLVRWTLRFFKQVTDGVEFVLYSVDEWLRFRSDESRLMMVMRAVLEVVWFPVGYLVRFYFLTLLEPTLNPIKLPFSSLAFKLMFPIPFYQHLLLPSTHEAWLAPYTGSHLAIVLAFACLIPTFWLLPGVFAFFAWEMQANWRLFRANRPRGLHPVVIGKHGETMLQLLKPGIHSGTIPRLFSNLRHAERAAYVSDDWRPARTYRQALREVAKAVRLFIEREFIALLRQSKRWPHDTVSAGQIMLSCNRIRIELRHSSYPQESFWLAFDEHAGWLLGGLLQPGWSKYLTTEQRLVLSAALAGLYRIAGVDFVREQVVAALPSQVPGYDFTDHYLLVWTGQRNSHEVAYNLCDRREQLRPRQFNGEPVDHLPTLEARRLFFSRVPLTWEQWVEFWQQDQEAKSQPRLFQDGAPLLI